MINYVVQHECELSAFPAWAGGLRVLDELCEHEEAYEYVQNYIEEVIREMDPAGLPIPLSTTCCGLIFQTC